MLLRSLTSNPMTGGILRQSLMTFASLVSGSNAMAGLFLWDAPSSVRSAPLYLKGMLSLGDSLFFSRKCQDLAVDFKPMFTLLLSLFLLVRSPRRCVCLCSFVSDLRDLAESPVMSHSSVWSWCITAGEPAMWNIQLFAYVRGRTRPHTHGGWIMRRVRATIFLKASASVKVWIPKLCCLINKEYTQTCLQILLFIMMPLSCQQNILLSTADPVKCGAVTFRASYSLVQES